MGDFFLLFPQNEAFIRGEKPTPQNKVGVFQSGCVFLFLIPFVVASVFLILFCVNMLYEGFVLSQSSFQTTGQVMALNEHEDEGDIIYSMNYQYILADHIYTDSQSVSADIYAAYQVGQPIDISYAAGDVTVSHITGTDTTPLNLFLLGFTVIWITIVGFMTTFIVTQWQRTRRLQREGKVIRGELVSIKGEMDEDDYLVTVVARFWSPSTLQTVSGNRRYTCNHLKGKPFQSPGTALAIHYADEKVWEIL